METTETIQNFQPMYKKSQIALIHFLSCIMVLFTILSIYAAVHYGLSDLFYTYVINVGIDIVMMIVLCIIAFTSYSMEKSSVPFALLLFFVSMNLFMDELAWISNHRADMIFINQLSNFIFYINAFLIFDSYWVYLGTIMRRKELYQKITKLIVFISIAGIIPIFVNLFYPLYYYIDDAGNYTRTAYFSLAHIPSIIFFIVFFILIFTDTMPLFEKAIVSTYLLFPLVAMVVQALFYGLSILYVATSFSLIVIYCCLHVEKQRMLSEEREKLANARLELMEREKEIMEGQTQIMISQIQPHFLYNALGSIGHLYKKDPEKAAEATNRFAKYLRMNLDSFDRLTTVSFSDELEHVKTYLDLEKMRYDDLEVDYSQIEDTDFMVPALSIQPLVENAVIHGFMSREDGGKIIIMEKESEECHEIIIEDDGEGYDVNHPKLDASKSHIGLENVKTRLANMVGGSLQIESEIGKGTVVRVSIPKDQ